MITKLVESFLAERFEQFNKTLDTSIIINQIESNIDLRYLPANESAINYMFTLTDLSSIDEYETIDFDRLTVRIDFIFLVAGRDSSAYREIYDRYLFPLRRLFRNIITYSNNDISAFLSINEISRVQITSESIYDEGYFKPSMEIDMRICDETEVSEHILYNPNTL